MNIVTVRERPEMKDVFIAYFQEKWAGEDKRSRMVYEDCISKRLSSESPLPEWYLLMEGDKICGGAGLIANDFISRMDLFPWICAVYVEPEYRGHAYGALLLNRARQDAAQKGYARVYLCTDHVGYYEEYGFSYIGTGYHPWGDDSRIYVADTGAVSSRTCLYAGSFDPPTVGHLDLIQRARGLFDRVVVAVMRNADKKGMFTPEERVELLKKCLKGAGNVDVLCDDGLTVEVARRVGAGVLLRGVRGEGDMGLEAQLAAVNRQISGIETLLLCADPRYGMVSSTVVRDVLRHGGPIEGMVPEAILAEVRGRSNS